MTVDSYAFLPRAFRTMYEAAPEADHDPVWADFDKPLREAKVALLSSAGMFLTGEQPPFDIERERLEPTWGDPTMRLIGSGTTQSQIDATHLHLNTADLLTDMDVALPIHRLNELVAAREVGAAASEHYSLMGYQEDGAKVWQNKTGPEIAAHCHANDIDALILAPA